MLTAAFRVGLLTFLLVVLSAAALILAFPGQGLDFLAWIALVPLLVVINGAGAGRAYVLSAVAGLLFFAGLFWWIWVIPGFNLLDFVVLELYFAQYFALCGMLLSVVTRGARLPTVIAAPVLWVSFEYIRAHLSFLALPVALLGHTQYRRLPLIQLVSVTGVYGLSFLIVLVNAALADLLARIASRPRLWSTSPNWRNWFGRLAPITMAAFLFAMTALYGFRVLAAEPGGEHITVGVIQRNLPARMSADGQARAERLDGYLTLSRQLADGNPALIVWPETAVVGPLLTTPALLAPIARVAQSANSYILLGTAESRKLASAGSSQGVTFNSAVLVSPAGKIEGVYRKIRLVPFGEYTPLAGILTWPAWLVAGGDQLTPGIDHSVFSLPTARFGVVICWESLFPDLVGAVVRKGADFVVNIGNEAWFGTTVAPDHLAAISVFRAVEHRVALVRSVNGGVSGFIDPHGRIRGGFWPRERNGAFEERVLAQAISIPRQLTFYTRYGDLAAYVCIGAAVAMLGLAFVQSGWAP